MSGFLVRLLTGNPYGLAILAGVWLVSVLAAAGAAGWAGWDWASARCAAEKLEAVAEKLEAERSAFELYREDVERMNRLAGASIEREEERNRVVYQPIFRVLTKVVEQPVYARECIDDAGLRLLNAAIEGVRPDPADADAAVRADGAARRDGPEEQDGRGAAAGVGDAGAAPR